MYLVALLIAILSELRKQNQFCQSLVKHATSNTRVRCMTHTHAELGRQSTTICFIMHQINYSHLNIIALLLSILIKIYLEVIQQHVVKVGSSKKYNALHFLIRNISSNLHWQKYMPEKLTKVRIFYLFSLFIYLFFIVFGAPTKRARGPRGYFIFLFNQKDLTFCNQSLFFSLFSRLYRDRGKGLGIIHLRTTRPKKLNNYVCIL